MANPLLNSNVEGYKKYNRKHSLGYQKYEEVFFMSAPDLLYQIKAKDKEYKDKEVEDKNSLPNESPHSWVILVAVFLYNVIMGYHFMCFGIYYVKFTEAFDTTKAASGMIGSLHACIGSLISLFASVFIELYGLKLVACTGVLLCFGGIFLSAFATNIYFLYVTYGCITGIGVSFSFLPGLVIIQEHFHKHRNFATSISACGLPLGNVVSPFISNLLLDTFGWRSTLLMHSAIVLNTLVVVMLFSPPETQYNNKQQNKGKASLSNFIKSLLDFSILKNILYLPFTLSIVLARILIGAFYDHTPSRAVFLGSDLNVAGYLLTTLCLGNLISRVVCSIIMGLFGFINPILAMSLAFLAESIMCGVLPLCGSFMAVVGVTFGFGCAQGLVVPVITLVIVKIAGVKRFAKTRAITNMFGSIGSGVATPLTGWMFDVTQNYDIPFYFSAIVGLLSALCGFIVFIMYKFKRRNRKQGDSDEKTEQQLFIRDVKRIRTFTF